MREGCTPKRKRDLLRPQGSSRGEGRFIWWSLHPFGDLDAKQLQALLERS